jgi:hypothetical protein
MSLPRAISVVLQSVLASLVLGFAGISPADEVASPRDGRARLAGEVVRAITGVAQANSRARKRERREGDELTNLYVRTAAATAREFPSEHAPSAFLTAIGIALDDSDFMLANPLTRRLCQQVESEAERAERLEVIGRPTMLGRHDLTQHFAVSAWLAAEMGGTVADAAGLAKEVLDAQNGGGLSFADLAADKAGVIFAEHVVAGTISLDNLAEHFAVRRYMPVVDGLPEGIRPEVFNDQYGSGSGERFREMMEEIVERIESLPAYEPNDRR